MVELKQEVIYFFSPQTAYVVERLGQGIPGCMEGHCDLKQNCSRLDYMKNKQTTNIIFAGQQLTIHSGER